jgi:hypothetical protein
MTNYLDALTKRIYARQDNMRQTQDPRFLAAQMAATPAPQEVAPVQRGESLQRSTTPLDEFTLMKKEAMNRISDQFGTAQTEGDLALSRNLAAGGMQSSGLRNRIQGENAAKLKAAESGAQTSAETQIGAAQASEKERRFEYDKANQEMQYQFDAGSQEARRQFDAGLAFQKSSLGLQLIQNWDKMDLTQKEDVFNQMIAIKESGIKPKDVDKFRSLFEGMRVDQNTQSLPNTVNTKNSWGIPVTEYA